MKKIIAMLLVLVSLFALAACGNTADVEKSEGVMTYEEYAAAEINSEVTIEAYVQNTQSWWFDDSVGHGKITIYAQDAVGGYFLYEVACDEETAEKLVPGTKIRAAGYKAEWEGEVEIMEASIEILDGKYTAKATDVTKILGTEELADYMNMFVSFKGMTVEPSYDVDGNEVAFLYNWDGSGQPGNDLYFNVSVDGNTYNFTVESYLTGDGTDVYEAVEALQIGDTVDMEGFLYWYQGANPHITSLKVK